jgi:hypothetical protein
MVLKLGDSQQFENRQIFQPISLVGFHKLNLRNFNICFRKLFFYIFFFDKKIGFEYIFSSLKIHNFISFNNSSKLF